MFISPGCSHGGQPSESPDIRKKILVTEQTPKNKERKLKQKEKVQISRVTTTEVVFVKYILLQMPLISPVRTDDKRVDVQNLYKYKSSHVTCVISHEGLLLFVYPFQHTMTLLPGAQFTLE